MRPTGGQRSPTARRGPGQGGVCSRSCRLAPEAIVLGHNLGPTWCLGPKSHLERKRKGDPLRPGPKGRPAGWVYGQFGSFGQFRGKSRGQDPGPADFPPIRRPRGNGMRRAKQRARLPLPSSVLARGETRGHLQKGWRACPGEHLQVCHANLIKDALEIGFEEF